MENTFLTLGLCLIALGFLLLLGELFVTSGLLLVLAVGSLAVGVVFLFKHDTLTGVYGLVGVLVAIPAGGALILRMLPHTPLGRMAEPPDEELADEPAHRRDLLALKGRVGKALTELRPAGMVDFDGRRIDSITEGILVEPGRWVRCVEVRGNTVVVRPVAGPDTFTLETAQLD
ncbi:MAG: NfeD family protein [Gemmataceae bacterium]